MLAMQGRGSEFDPQDPRKKVECGGHAFVTRA